MFTEIDQICEFSLRNFLFEFSFPPGTIFPSKVYTFKVTCSKLTLAIYLMNVLKVTNTAPSSSIEVDLTKFEQIT